MNPRLGKILFITIFILLIISGVTLSLMYRDVNTEEPTATEEVNLPPSFVTLPPTQVNIGEEVEYIVRVSDQDTDEAELELILYESPSWIGMAGGILFGQPGIDDLGSHKIDISVSDGDNTVHQEFYIVVEQDNDQNI